MEPARYLKAFRRRLGVDRRMHPGRARRRMDHDGDREPPQITPPPTQQYSAEVLLLSDGSSPDPIVTNLDTLAVVATTSPVLEKVAAILDFKGNPTALTPTVVADHDTGILTISVVSDDREQAIKLADCLRAGVDGISDGSEDGVHAAADRSAGRQDPGAADIGWAWRRSCDPR